MSNIDRRKLMIGGGWSGFYECRDSAFAEQERVALSGTITEFYQFLVKFRALPPKVQKAVLIILKWDTQRG
jgi:hypothetical protein